MSVSIYYTARRPAPLTEAERDTLEGVLEACEAAHPFPGEYEEGVRLYYDGLSGPDTVAFGATKLSSDMDRAFRMIDYVLDSASALHRVLPGADWHIHLDDIDIPWDEQQGYRLPDEPP